MLVDRTHLVELSRPKGITHLDSIGKHRLHLLQNLSDNPEQRSSNNAPTIRSAQQSSPHYLSGIALTTDNRQLRNTWNKVETPPLALRLFLLLEVPFLPGL
jgi:hypothetical protein